MLTLIMTVPVGLAGTGKGDYVSAFFEASSGPDKRYNRLAKAEFSNEHDARKLVEELWSETGAFLDRDVQTSAPQEFLARFWEMYVAAALLRRPLPLVPTADRDLRVGGPDLLVREPKTYVEAVIATPGTGPDAVTPPEPMIVRDVPRVGIILRLRAAIDEKHRKYLRYLQTGAVKPGDPYVIALNAAAVPSIRGEPTLPWIVNAVLPFGLDVYHLDRKTREVVGHSFEQEYDVIKKSGSPVAKDIFLDPDYAGISAILYGCVDEYNNSGFPGSEFTIIHNLLATNPIPRGLLPGYHELWVENDHLRGEKRDGNT